MKRKTSTRIQTTQHIQHRPCSSAAISKLSSEVLRIIMLFAKVAYCVHPHTFCHVSRRWHKVATETRRLWTSITLDPYRPLHRLQVELHRSYPLPIDLTLDFRRGLSSTSSNQIQYFDKRQIPTGLEDILVKDIATQLTQSTNEDVAWTDAAKRILHTGHLVRSRSIVVKGVSCHAILAATCILQHTRNHSAPYLEKFSINTSCDRQKCNDDVPWLKTDKIDFPSSKVGKCRFTYMHLANSSFFQKGAPKLTHLTLSTLSIPCTYIPFDNVHSLTLSSSGRWTHPTHLADFLNDSRFPKLKSLHLHHDILFSRSKLQKSPIELKALRTLKFSGYHTKSANALSCLYTPNLRHLILDTLYPDQFSRLQFYQLLKQTPNKYPKLKKLTLRASEDQASEDQGADELLEQIVSPDSIIPIDIVPESQRLIPQTVLHIAHVFPNIQKLVINKALVHPLNVIVSQKEMDIEGNDTTSSVWNAWPDLKMIQVEVVAPNWGVIVLNESLKKGRNERDDVKVVYRRRTKLNRGMKS